MIKFCKIDNIYYICDDNTIKLRNLIVEKELDEEEYFRLGGDFYQVGDELIIGKNPKGEAQRQIAELKSQLASMDYKSSKYVDGEYKEEEWALIVAERKAIRERIRELEKF